MARTTFRLTARLSVLFGTVLIAIGFLFPGTQPSAAQSETEDEVEFSRIEVVELDGPIDKVQRDFLNEAFDRAESGSVEVLILQVNSPGALGVDVGPLVERFRSLPIPTMAWVGPGHAEARGDSIAFVLAATRAHMGPDAKMGPYNPGDLKANDFVSNVPDTRSRARLSASADTDLNMLLDDKIGVAEAVAAGLVEPGGGDQAVTEGAVPIIGEAIVLLDELPMTLDSGETVQLDVARPGVTDSGEQVPQLTVVTTFFRISYVPNFFHKANTPSFAYVMLMAGLAAIVFEFFAASIGISGVIGAFCLLVSTIAMANLPMNWWAVGLLALGILLFSIDVQQGQLGGFSALGAVALVLGSIFFTYGDAYDVRWWTIVLVVGGLIAFYSVVMTTIMRTRFATPTIGRDHLIGRVAIAATVLNPEGTVSIDGAVWPARSVRGKVDAAERVTVRSVGGVVLDVVPGVEEDEESEPANA